MGSIPGPGTRIPHANLKDKTEAHQEAADPTNHFVDSTRKSTQESLSKPHLQIPQLVQVYPQGSAHVTDLLWPAPCTHPHGQGVWILADNLQAQAESCRDSGTDRGHQTWAFSGHKPRDIKQ